MKVHHQQQSNSPQGKVKRLATAPLIPHQIPIEASVILCENVTVASKKRLKAAKYPKGNLKLKKIRLEHVIEEDVWIT